MAKKPFALRIDPDKLKALEKWAADEFRSTNGQIEWIIDQALKKAGRAVRRARFRQKQKGLVTEFPELLLRS